MYESQDYFIPIIWEGDGSHPSPNYDSRYGDYNVMALPSTGIDGDTFDLGGGTGVLGRYQTLYGNRVLVDSPMEIDVVLDVTDEGMAEITADVLMTDDIPATEDYRIIILLTYFYSESYNSTVINYHEEDFDLSTNGESQQFIQEFELDDGMDMGLTRAVVLVQYVNTTGVFTVNGYPQYPFNMYPILQAGIATYALQAPNPISNLEMELNDTEVIDLTDFFYYNGEPVAADITVESTDPGIVEASLDGNLLTLSSYDSGGMVTITINGSYLGDTAVSTFNVFVVDPDDHYIVILDFDPTPMGETLQASIENFYTAGDVHLTSDISEFPLNANADAVFVLLGIYSDNYVLTETEGVPLAEYLDQGGNLYLEGGDTWYWDDPTTVHPYFNINATSDGAFGGDLTTVTGYDFMEGYSWSYSGENSYIDNLVPVAPAITIFSNDVVGYDCGIYHDEGTYKTVGTSFEITGLGGNSTLDDAVAGILEFFGVMGTPETYYPPENVMVNEDTGLVSWDEPVVPFDFMDDFEGYVVGQNLAEFNDDWTTWSNSPGGSEDGVISDDFAYSGTQSLFLVDGNDQVLPFGELTTGIYEAGIMVYVPSGYCGYFNLLHLLDDYGSANEWGLEVYFRDTGVIDINAGGTGSVSSTYTPDTWLYCKAIIDLDADQAEFYIDESLIHSWQWSIQANGTPGANQLSAMNIWGGGAAGQTPNFYVDDVYISPYELDRDLTGYNVYLDGEMVAGNISETEFLLENLVHGQLYTAGVAAVYDGGISAIIEVEFTYSGTGADDGIVLRTKLHGNYPNPFNPTTTISYSLKNSSKVSLEIYNVRGQLVRILVDDVMEAGPQQSEWNGKDDANNKVSSGVYFYKLNAGDYSSTKKMILLK
ncbi:T9SS type A sorting domain-containing protein [Candidatus Cloacimonadota bacterium]